MADGAGLRQQIGNYARAVKFSGRSLFIIMSGSNTSGGAGSGGVDPEVTLVAAGSVDGIDRIDSRTNRITDAVNVRIEKLALYRIPISGTFSISVTGTAKTPHIFNRSADIFVSVVGRSFKTIAAVEAALADTREGHTLRVITSAAKAASPPLGSLTDNIVFTTTITFDGGTASISTINADFTT
jgi:hypothetical protein